MWYDNFKNPQGFFGKLFIIYMNHSNEESSNYGINFLEAIPNSNILDIGCGGGANIKKLLKRFPNSKATGIDISSLACKETLRKNKSNKNNVFAHNCDAIKIPYEEESFDVITSFETAYFLKDIATYFKETYRVLKHSGKFMIELKISNPKAWIVNKIDGFRVYTRKQLKDCLISAGFKDIEIHYNSKHYVVAIGGK